MSSSCRAGPGTPGSPSSGRTGTMSTGSSTSSALWPSRPNGATSCPRRRSWSPTCSSPRRSASTRSCSSCASPGCNWPLSSTNTAARPGSSLWKMSSRNSSGISPTSMTGRVLPVVEPRTAPGRCQATGVRMRCAPDSGRRCRTTRHTGPSGGSSWRRSGGFRIGVTWCRCRAGTCECSGWKDAGSPGSGSSR